MKILFGSSTILLLIFLASLEGGLSSCTKDKTIYDTVTVIKNDTTTIVQKDTVTIKDTLIIKDTAFTAAILTSHPWKIQELRGVLEGTVYYYLRGGGANTINFTNEYTVFNSDHTGYTIDQAGANHVISNWDLTTDEKPTLTFTFYNTPSVTSLITWDNISFKNNAWYYDDYYHDNFVDQDYHGQEIRIAK